MISIIDFFSNVLGTYITPAVLLISAIILTPSSGILKILKPKKIIEAFGKNNKTAKVSPFKALSVALAGTLGVGNITGVASALISGGPGAVFWMWIGAFAVISVKYSEVYLAVKYRRKDENGYYGGAMYYINDGLKNTAASNKTNVLASFFAILCCMNSLITGNLVQANAAAAVFSSTHKITVGCILAGAIAVSIIFGGNKIEKITAKLLPPLTFCYIALSVVIIFRNFSLIGEIFNDIISSAFTFRSVAGGALGFSVREAIRFGIIRGIFSNEAGCGTSPTAHASADTVSGSHQGLMGVVEVFFDTIVLCTLSAFVMLIADKRFECLPWGTDADAAEITLESFSGLAGNGALIFIMIAIILFAYSTIIAQFYYGKVAIRFLSEKKGPQIAFSVLSIITVLIGSVLYSQFVWLLADIIIGTMTAINCVVVILLRSDLRSSVRLPG